MTERGPDMSLAIAALQECLKKLEEDYKGKTTELAAQYKRDREEILRALDNLRNPPPPKDAAGIVIEQGGWEGMCLTDSIHNLLLRERKPMQFPRIIKALTVAGVRMGDPEKPKRYGANVKTTIINNRKRFRYDKRSNTVRLVKTPTQLAVV